MIKIAVFASGNGSNALNLFQYFNQHPSITFVKIYCNNPKAGIIDKAKTHQIACRCFTKNEWNSGVITSELKNDKIDYIILAGFLWLVPSALINQFPNRIINIHPSLLPNYGGKGMYGMHVHQSIIKNKETESGITIHLVNEEYDKGKILYQAKVDLSMDETPESLASKIHFLEHKFFPVAVENYILEVNKKGP